MTCWHATDAQNHLGYTAETVINYTLPCFWGDLVRIWCPTWWTSRSDSGYIMIYQGFYLPFWWKLQVWASQIHAATRLWWVLTQNKLSLDDTKQNLKRWYQTEPKASCKLMAPLPLVWLANTQNGRAPLPARPGVQLRCCWRACSSRWDGWNTGKNAYATKVLRTSGDVVYKNLYLSQNTPHVALLLVFR